MYIRDLEKTDTSVRFFVGLYDRERGNDFKGETEKDRNSLTHIMSDLPLRTDDGTKKTIDRLYLHTWVTNYVFGRTEWRGNCYGFHFAQEYWRTLRSSWRKDCRDYGSPARTPPSDRRSDGPVLVTLA